MGVNTRNRQDNNYLNYITRVVNDNGLFEQVPLVQYKEQYDKLMIFNPTYLFYPSSKKNGTLYSVLPNNNTPNLTFTRSSVATYFDANNRLQIAQNNEPRLEWDPITNTYGGLILEGSFTNNITNNNSDILIAQAGSSSYSTPIRLDNEFGDGVNGFYMSHTSGTFLSGTYTLGNAQFSVASGSSLHYSTIIKNPSGNFGVNLSIIGSVYYNFSTLQSRNVGDNTNITNHSISKIGTNTYKLSANFITPNSVQFFQNRQGIILNYNSLNSPVVDGNFIMGLPTLVISNNTLPNKISLIPTTGSSITKQADNPQLNNISSFFSDTSGSIYVEFEKTQNNLQKEYFWISTSFSDYLLRIRVDGNNSLRFLYFTPGMLGAGTYFSFNVVAINYFKIIFTYNYSNNSFKIFVNGIKYADSILVSHTLPINQTTMNIGNLGGNSSNDTVKFVSVYNYPLSDEQSINLTTI